MQVFLRQIETAVNAVDIVANIDRNLTCFRIDFKHPHGSRLPSSAHTTGFQDCRWISYSERLPKGKLTILGDG